MSHVASFLSTLMASRNQAHIFHLQTQSYAAHMALDAYYNGIIDLIDSYAEEYQGQFGIIKGYTLPESIFEDDSALKYFTGLFTYIGSVRQQLPQDTSLNNIVDEIVSLITSTIYKLKFLK